MTHAQVVAACRPGTAAAWLPAAQCQRGPSRSTWTWSAHRHAGMYAGPGDGDLAIEIEP